jgi:hypothetical protein
MTIQDSIMALQQPQDSGGMKLGPCWQIQERQLFLRSGWALPYNFLSAKNFFPAKYDTSSFEG